MCLGILYILLAMSPAWAFQASPLAGSQSLFHRVDFIPAQEGFAQLRIPLNAMAASQQVTFLDAGGKFIDACSSSVVSDSGHILMAGHCLDACLNAAGALRTQEGIPVVDRSRLASVTCQVEIDGQRSQAKILATNDCHARNDLNKMAASGVRCQNSDFAILKVQPEVTKKRSCFHVSTRLPNDGDKVASVGYSFKSYRGLTRDSATDSNGKDQVISTGKAIRFRDSCDTMEDDERAPVRRSFGAGDRQKRMLQKLTDEGELIQTYGAEFLKKGSGGALIDAQTGELLGVSSFYIKNNNQFNECRGSTFFSSTLSMLKVLKSDYPEMDLRGVFACDKKAFVPGADLDSPDVPRPIPADLSPAKTSR